MEAKGIVEAALFSAGRPLKVSEIHEKTGLSQERIRRSLRELMNEYGQRSSAIEVAKTGTRYVMQVRMEYNDCAIEFSSAVLPKEVLKTAALIAYHQPVKQSDLRAMVGSGVYDHVRKLKELKLVSTKPHGSTVRITTSRKFSDFFGIDKRKKEDIKRWMAERTGFIEGKNGGQGESKI